MTVTYSARFKAMRDGDPMKVRNELSKQGLLYFLNTSAPKNFMEKKWRTQLNPQYRKWKVKMGGRGIANLLLSNNLLRAATTEAIEGVQVEDGTATATIKSSAVPYAAAHQYGNPAKNLPARPFWEIETHLNDITKHIDSILEGVVSKT